MFRETEPTNSHVMMWSRAAVAPSVQRDLVTVEHESLRDHLVHPSRAAAHIKHPIASDAMEVVVVFCRALGEFVSIWLTGYRHWGDP